jgi:hypothetical protein
VSRTATAATWRARDHQGRHPQPIPQNNDRHPPKQFFVGAGGISRAPSAHLFRSALARPSATLRPPGTGKGANRGPLGSSEPSANATRLVGFPGKLVPACQGQVPVRTDRQTAAVPRLGRRSGSATPARARRSRPKIGGRPARVGRRSDADRGGGTSILNSRRQAPGDGRSRASSSLRRLAGPGIAGGPRPESRARATARPSRPRRIPGPSRPV